TLSTSDQTSSTPPPNLSAAPSSHPLSSIPLHLVDQGWQRESAAATGDGASEGGMPALVVAHGGTGGRRAGDASAPHGLTLDHCSTNHRLAPALSLLCLLLSSAVSLGLARSPFCGSTLSLAAYNGSLCRL
ncbi:unnamed protein product, partial [Urochloa humidicola]